MHFKNARKLIQRQLEKHALSFEIAPRDSKTWGEFVSRVERAYAEYESARLSNENVLEVSIREMESMTLALRREDRQRLSELNEHLTLLLDASELGTWDWNLKDDSVNFNARWCEMIGLNPDTTPRKLETFVSHVHPEDFDAVMANARKYLERLTPRFESRFRMRHADGHWVNIVARGKVTRFDSNGRPIRFMGTHLDVSEEVRLHSELENQKLQLNHTSRLAALGEMSAGIAHEINNPLAVIQGYVNLIPKYLNQSAKILEITGNSQKAAQRIEKIVKGLKKFSRTENKMSLLHHSLCEVARESIALSESKSKFHGVPVMFECTAHPEILCDEIEIEQVVVNLVNNAIDAVKALPEKWVKVKVFEREGSAILQVQDSGTGIPTEVEARIFDPFYTTKAVNEGTGLGLSIARGILTEHHASIEVLRSEPHTCFEIKFAKAGS